MSKWKHNVLKECKPFAKWCRACKKELDKKISVQNDKDCFHRKCAYQIINAQENFDFKFK